MKGLWVRFAAVAVLVFVLAACGAGPQAITQAFARDQLFSIEPRVNGTATLWLMHDDVGSYCTLNQDIIAKAQQVLASENTEVVIEYRSLNNDDPEYSIARGIGGGCAKEGDDDHTTYLILNFYTVEEYRALIEGTTGE